LADEGVCVEGVAVAGGGNVFFADWFGGFAGGY
jgi:hypothetical protein